MPIDVNTLYVLIVCTTLTGACLTVWQRRTQPAHRVEMGFWAIGYVLIGLGCFLRIFNGALSPFLAIGVSNLAVLAGYGAVTAGVLVFADGRVPRFFSVAAAGVATGWLGWGQYAPIEWRIVLTALAVAATSFHAAFVLGASSGRGALAARRLVRTMFALHGAFFVGRAAVTVSGWEATVAFNGANFAVTMVEGILWSTFIPAALLIMVRDSRERELVAASETDFLTGIDNRRAFTAKATNLIADHAPASLAVFDLDHFKAINDRHGHALGDDVLRQFCRTVEANLMPGDVFGRLGGEEFAVAFHGCGAAEAQRRARGLSRLYTTETAVRFALSLDATVSVGIAEADGTASLQQLLGAADAALYRAKKAGRDRVVVAEPAPAAPAARSADLAARAA